MKHTNESHPVPLNERTTLPCGCQQERRPLGERWYYVTFIKPDCRFGAKRIGRHMPGSLQVPFNANEDEVLRALKSVSGVRK